MREVSRPLPPCRPAALPPCRPAALPPCRPAALPPCWALAGALAVAAMASLILAAAVLDIFVFRPAPMSVTTVLPGLVYASATVVKACLAASVTLAVAHFVRTGVRSGQPLPGWGVAALTLPAFTPAAGALVALAAQGLMSNPAGAVSSRCGVLAMLAMICLGATSAACSLYRRERPGIVAVIGLLMNVALISLFWWLDFQAPWFHHDTWAER